MSGERDNNLNNINELIPSPLILSVGPVGTEVEGLGEYTISHPKILTLSED